jgi:putative nucleotidyltransferase with HDIG domain
MAPVSLEEVAQRIESLEASQPVAIRVLSLLDRDDIGAREVAVVASTDPALVRRIMQMANSAFFGTGGRIKELHVAVAAIGFSAVRSLAMAGLVEGVGSVTPQDWRHSVTSAVAAMEVAKRVGADQQQVFTVALLHDIGEAVIASVEPSYRDVIEKWRKAPLTAESEHEMLQWERKEFGITHAALGADMLANWNFSNEIVEAVARHHPNKGNISRVHGAVVDGDRIAHLLTVGLNPNDELVREESLMPEYIRPDELASLVAEVEAKSTTMLKDLF